MTTDLRVEISRIKLTRRHFEPVVLKNLEGSTNVILSSELLVMTSDFNLVFKLLFILLRPIILKGLWSSTNNTPHRIFSLLKTGSSESRRLYSRQVQGSPYHLDSVTLYDRQGDQSQERTEWTGHRTRNNLPEY